MWDLVPWLELEPGLLALRTWNLSHWTIREVPLLYSLTWPFSICSLLMSLSLRMKTPVLWIPVPCLWPHLTIMTPLEGFPGLPSGKEPTCQCKKFRRRGFNPWSESSPGRGQILAWRIPWTEEPGWLQPIGSQRVRRDWSNLARSMHFLKGSMASYNHTMG